MASLGHNGLKAALSNKEKMGCDIKRAKVVITRPCRNRSYTNLMKLVFCVLRNRLAFTASSISAVPKQQAAITWLMYER